MDFGNDIDAIDQNLLTGRRTQGRMQRRAFFMVLTASPRNIAAVRSRKPHSVASATSSWSVSPMMRFFE